MTDRFHCQPLRRRNSASTIVLCLIWALLLTPIAAADSLALLDADIVFAGKGDMRLSPEGYESLRQLTLTLERFAGILSIRIIGHTDDVGEEAINHRISQQRADWIKNHFKTRFPRAHIMSLGAGESIPYASNHNDAGRARNQRVQIQVIASGSVPGRD